MKFYTVLKVVLSVALLGIIVVAVVNQPSDQPQVQQVPVQQQGSKFNF